ncbi:hypothetical protein ACQEWB_35605 [Streptomyces sp. CA-249302]|uniref:hypothetical protein n=1 Tax=Streptomyces sp. CA-249302 TaxID=3240058 RepID=UPI003D8A624D
MESEEPLPLEDVSPLEEDEESLEDELLEDDEVLSDEDEVLDDEDELVSLLLLLLDPVSLLVVEDAALVSVFIVPINANIPAAAARVTAAAVAAVRRAPLRTAAAAPRSLVVMTVPLPSDALSRTKVGQRPERSL